MKYLALIPLVFVASCASRPQIVVRPAPPAAVEPVEAVRYSEVVRAYYVGRFVDPNHPETMNEQHPVYRIETSARWNLHPGPANTVNLLNPPPDAAFATPPTNDAVIAEMNRQREATERVMSEAVRLSRSYEELQNIFSQMKTVARNNALLGARVANTEQRVADFGKELEKITTTPSAQTNDIPAFVPDPPDAPKP
ncbi:MAG TPA: hypothetical protein VHZ30_01785 [Verrucomicrobiae bacterium]|jgi:hypothetical protein|nr:hypothetical protein [Verrucomicrobiae bacterium]